MSGNIGVQNLSNKEIKTRRIKKFFIERTVFLIRQDGISNLTIRNIANGTGYNSATIYNYFEDLDHLILYSSLKYLQAYTAELTNIIDDTMDFRTKYVRICTTFNKHTFASPDIFWNMFYGKHSDKLDDVIREYYELYPEELGTHSETVTAMLYSGNIFKRDRVLINKLAEDGFIPISDIETVLQIVTRLHQSYLYEIYMNKGKIDPDEHNRNNIALTQSVLDHYIDERK